MDDRMRQLLRDRAEDIPSFREMPPRLKTRARRRIALRFGAAFVAVTVLMIGAFAGVRSLIRSEEPRPADRTPAPGALRANGEVLSFTHGDLVAVNPETGEGRVLVGDLDLVYSAGWSADGRWVAYETPAPGGIGLWVVSASQEPRQVATGGKPGLFASLALSWMWSPTGAELATIDRSRLSTIDPATGETTDLGSIVGDAELNVVTSAWAWSPDGTRIVFVARGGELYSVDVRSGERSLLVRLPGENLDSISEILWSPDGAYIAVESASMSSSTRRLFLVNVPRPEVAGGDSFFEVLVDDFDPGGVAWSPDGTRLAYADWSEPARKVRISVAPMDGSASVEIGSLVASCHFAYKCGITWSPDGSRIAFKTETGLPIPGEGPAVTSAIAADGSGDAVRIDELTYRSWDGGWYSCDCT